ncbi:MAG TPA: hypothetical protein VG367_15465 [Mucilaginibacter sp.]|jgi:hypothetical protein|nr:hypothetical protein [Mucilaginibacter sp.]
MGPLGTIHANQHAILCQALTHEFAEVYSKKIYGELKISQDHYKCRGLSFINCEFDDTISFKVIDLKFGVRFIDCVFNGHCFFDQVKATGIDDAFNQDNVGIYFKNCSHSKSLTIANSKLERALRLYNQQNLSSLKISRLEAHAVDLQECKIGGIDVEHTNTVIGFRIEKSEVSGQGRYFGSTGDGFTFMSTVFKRDQQLWANNVRSITTNDGEFEDELKIKACKAETYTFYGTKFKKAVNIVTLDTANGIDAVVDSIYLRNCNFEGGFTFTGNKQLIGGQINCGKLVIGCSNLLAGNIVFEKTDIRELEVGGANVTASVSFSNCGFKVVHIDNFINQGKLYFADVESIDRNGSVFSLAKTSLGTSIFLNVNLLHFEKIIIKHSNLTDIIFTDVVWFKPNQLNPVDTFTDKVTIDIDADFKKKNGDYRNWSLYKTNREVYRQLKYTALKIGNTVQSISFQSQEMRHYKKELEYYRPFGRFAGNKAMMWMNQSNNYGNAWIKPVWIFLLLNLGFYLIITILQSGEYDLWPSFHNDDIKSTWTLLTTHLDAYWGLLNPVRKLSDVYPDHKYFSAWTMFWDYLDRLAIAYFVFQIVSAFRKYTK